MSSVKVAVRVRPLNKKEKDRESKFIVDVNGDSISVTNIKVEGPTEYGDSREREKHFTFDYCYDSASQSPQALAYSSQEVVFQDLGTEVLQSAFEGYNACVLAYGQTSTGKTYTMMGNQDEVGLIPRICEGLFSHVDDFEEGNLSFRVKISYLEIYNERVRDLLRPALLKKNEKYTLKVREHPKDGPYVQDLSSHYVSDNSQIQAMLERGNEYRTTAATYMHDHSSRSHAIVTIEFTQAKLEDDLPHEIVSKIHLVDLAGSERADPSYSSNYKGRLREGANINKSLVTLGNVIKALAERSILAWSSDNLGSSTSFQSSTGADIGSPQSGSPKRRLPYIPYRDSVLTWLLRDSIGGNSKTIMIATVSPASIYYNETISTLRYAQRAKSILNKPRVNEDPNVSLIRDLRREVERLKELLMSTRVADSRTSLNEILFLLPPFTQKLHEREADIQQGESLHNSPEPADSLLAERLQENQTMVDQLTQTWIDKWQEAHEIIKDSELSIKGLKRRSDSMGILIESQQPHLVGMDDDILSTGVTIYHLKDGKTILGREDAVREQDIVLKGPGIQREHCFIKNYIGTVTLHPNRNAHCAVNGIDCRGPTKLKQGDYILLGKTNMFRYNNPVEAAKLRIKRHSSNEETLSPDDPRSISPSSPDPRPLHPLYAHQQLDQQYDNDPQRIEEAKQELRRLQTEHRKAVEDQQAKEEQLWRTHEQRKAEIEEQRRVLAEIADENSLHRQRAEEELQYAKECLEQEKEAFQKYLQEELIKLKTSSKLPIQDDSVESLDKVSENSREVIEKRKCSLEGRIKDLAQGELLKRLSYLESEQKLIQEEEEIDDQFTVAQEQLQCDLEQLRNVELGYRHSNANKLENLNLEGEVLEELEKKEEKLQSYIEEKEALLKVGSTKPTYLRYACSEEILNEPLDEEEDFPLRSSSLLNLQRGSEGDLPSLSKRLSMTSSLNVKSVDVLSDDDMEDDDNKSMISLCSSTSSLNSDTSAKLRRKDGSSEKSKKLSTTAKSVTDRLYRPPPPKFSYDSKDRSPSVADRSKRGGSAEKDINRTKRGASAEKEVDRAKRGGSAEKSIDRTKRGGSAEKALDRTKRGGSAEKALHRTKRGGSADKSIDRSKRGGSAEKTVDRMKRGGSAEKTVDRMKRGGSAEKDKAVKGTPSSKTLEKSGVDKKGVMLRKSSGRQDRTQTNSSDSTPTKSAVREKKDSSLSKQHPDTPRRRNLGAPLLRQSVSQPSLSTVPKSNSSKVVHRLIPAAGKIHKIASASSLACVPEAVGEEGDAMDVSKTSIQNVVRRKKRHHSNEDDTRRHSAPIGESLSEAFGQYAQEMGLMIGGQRSPESPSSDNGCMQIEEEESVPQNIPSIVFPEKSSMKESDVDSTCNAFQMDISFSENGDKSNIQPSNDNSVNVMQKESCDPVAMETVTAMECTFQSSSTESSVPSSTDNKVMEPLEGIHFECDTLNKDIEVIAKHGNDNTELMFSTDSDSPQEGVHRSIELDSDSGFYPESSDNFESSGALSFASSLATRLSVSSEQDPQHGSKDNDTLICSTHDGESGLPLEAAVRPSSLPEGGAVFTETDNSSVASPGDVHFFLPDSSDSGSENLKPGSKRELDSGFKESSLSTPPAKYRKEGESNQDLSVDGEEEETSSFPFEGINADVCLGDNEKEKVTGTQSGSVENVDSDSKPPNHEKDQTCISQKTDSNLSESHSRELKLHAEVRDSNILNDSVHIKESKDSNYLTELCDSPQVAAQDQLIHRRYSSDSLEGDSDSLDGSKPRSKSRDNDDFNDSLDDSDNEQWKGSKQQSKYNQIDNNTNTSVPCVQTELSIETDTAQVSSTSHDTFDKTLSLHSSDMVEDTSAVQNKDSDSNVFKPCDDSDGLDSGDKSECSSTEDFATSHGDSTSPTDQSHADVPSINPLSTSLLNHSLDHQVSPANSLPNSPSILPSTSSTSISHQLPPSDIELSSPSITSSLEVSVVGNSDDTSAKKFSQNENSDLQPEDKHSDGFSILDKYVAMETTPKTSESTERNRSEVAYPIGSGTDEDLVCEAPSLTQQNSQEHTDTSNTTPSTRTIGVSTTPDFLWDFDDVDSQCSHDSIQELQEQLQELEEFPVNQRVAGTNSVNSSTQLSSARKATRQRAVKRQKLRGAESDDVGQLSDEDSLASGNQARTSSRPTSASRRRRRTNTKSSDKNQHLKGLSSEECLTSESDGIYSEDSVTNKDQSSESIVFPSPQVSGEILQIKESLSQLESVLNVTEDSPKKNTEHLESDKNDSGRESVAGIEDLEHPSVRLHTESLVSRPSEMNNNEPNEQLKSENNDSDSEDENKGYATKMRSESGCRSRESSETRNMEQQTDVTMLRQANSLSGEPFGLAVSPVNVWMSNEKGLAVYGPQASRCRTESPESPKKVRKRSKPLNLVHTPPDVWSSDCYVDMDETVVASPPDSDDENTTYAVETEICSPKSPSKSDKFFPESEAREKAKPIKYHVTINEESTNITYNVDRTEYRTYGLRSQIHHPERIPDTISVNLTESSTEITDSRSASVHTENVNFHNSSFDGISAYPVIMERRFQTTHDATREGDDMLQRHFEEEMDACYIEPRHNTSTPHPVNVSIGSEELASKPESLLSPRESDTTSDYGTMIMDGRRGCMSFSLDSGDEADSLANKSVPGEEKSPTEDRIYPPRYIPTEFPNKRSDIPAWLQAGTQDISPTENESLSIISPEGHHLCPTEELQPLSTVAGSQTVPGDVEHISNVLETEPQAQLRRKSASSEEEVVMDELSFVVDDRLRPESMSKEDFMQQQLALALEKMHDRYDANGMDGESSDSSIYKTPQQSPRSENDMESSEVENVQIPDLEHANTKPQNSLPTQLQSQKLKTASVNTEELPNDKQQRSVDDSNVREAIKSELHRKLARLQRHVRSLSDSAISSDYTDGDSTTVSPRGSRLCESDKTLRTGVFMDQVDLRQRLGIDVRTTQTDTQFNPSAGEPFLSAVTKLVDIEKKEPKKSPLKDSGNVFDDDNETDDRTGSAEEEQVVENIVPVKADRQRQFRTDIEIPNIENHIENGQLLENEATFSGSNSDNSNLSLNRSIENQLGSKEFGSDLDYSDVIYTDSNSDSRSHSPGEIYLDESTPEKMFRNLPIGEPSEENLYQQFEAGIKSYDGRRSDNLHHPVKEKSPSMSDINTAPHRTDDIRRSYSENNIDEFEEDVSNSSGSNDSIIFVFMGQNKSSNAAGETNEVERQNDLSKDSDDKNQFSSNPDSSFIQDSSMSDDYVFRPIQDTSAECSDQNEKDYARNEVDSTSKSEQDISYSSESPLRHKFGIDEAVLPIPERSVSLDNIPKMTPSNKSMHRSRSASLLDVDLVENPDDPANNEGIFPPCIEDYESSVGSRDDSHQEPIHPDHSRNDRLRSTVSGSQELMYSSLPLEQQNQSTTNDVDYNGNLPTKEQLVFQPEHFASVAAQKTPSNVRNGETQTDNQPQSSQNGDDTRDHVLEPLASPYRSKSEGNLEVPNDLESIISKDTDDWQNSSTVVIETNALLNKITEKCPGINLNSSLDESSSSSPFSRPKRLQRTRDTQTGNSLKELKDSSIQTDLVEEKAANSKTDTISTQTEYEITNPRDWSETENVDVMPMFEEVFYRHTCSQTTDEDDSPDVSGSAGSLQTGSSGSIQSDTVDNVFTRLSNALRDDEYIDENGVIRSHEQVQETIENMGEVNASKPLTLKAGIKSQSAVVQNIEIKTKNTSNYESNHELVEDKIMKEERREQHSERKHSDENSQIVITERECVVEAEVKVPNMDVTNAEMEKLKKEHAKMMESLKKVSEERQQRRDALKAKLTKASKQRPDTTSRSTTHTLQEDITSEHRTKKSKKIIIEDTEDLEYIFQENEKYCQTHGIPDNLSDIVVNSDDDSNKSEGEVTEKQMASHQASLNTRCVTTESFPTKPKDSVTESKSVAAMARSWDDKIQSLYGGRRTVESKVMEDEILPQCHQRHQRAPLSNIFDKNTSRTSQISESSMLTEEITAILSDRSMRQTSESYEKLQRHGAQNRIIPLGSYENGTENREGSPLLKTPPNSPISGAQNTDNYSTPPKRSSTQTSVGTDAPMETANYSSLLSSTSKPNRSHDKVSTGIDVRVDSSDDFTQTDIDSLKLDLTGMDVSSDKVQKVDKTNEKSIKEELGRLQKEKVEIIELLSMNYLPASLTVELLEAKLNYCIGQTDMLMKTLEDNCDLDAVIEFNLNNAVHHTETREYLSTFKENLYRSKQDINSCKQRMERTVGRGRKLTRNRDIFKWRRNAEIEAFRIERMIENRNYEHSRSLSPLKPHNDTTERMSRSVSPSSSEGTPRTMTPKDHRNHLVDLRKKLIQETDSDILKPKTSRSCSPQTPYSERDYVSPRYRSYSPTHSLQSNEDLLRSPYGSNPRLAPPPSSSHVRSLLHSPSRTYGYERLDPYSHRIGSPSYSPRSPSSPARSSVSPTRSSISTSRSSALRTSISPSRYPRMSATPRQPISSMESSLYEHTDTCEQTTQLFQEMREARLKNQHEISRAQDTLSSLRRYRDSRDHFEVDSVRSYSSYSTYGRDANRLRSSHGVVTGTYELYEEPVTHRRPTSPVSSITSDIDLSSLPDSLNSDSSFANPGRFERTRPVRSTDLRTKILQKHAKLPMH